MKVRKENGITIIALVITIIVLIILATITINAVFGDNGLIKQAGYAKDLSSNSTESEYGEMNRLFDDYANMLEEDNEIPIEEEPSTVDEAKESGEIFDDTTTIKDDLENEVTIPGGFHIAEDSGTKVEEGIVIEDDSGNQFVWIPVGEYKTTDEDEPTKTNSLTRRTFTSSEATEVSGDNVIAYFYGEGNENSVAKDQIEEFKVSATTNKGFYIGRYEQGENNVCKSGVNAYVSVTRDQAKTQAEAMYSGNEYVTSELISSYAWDTASNFICQNSEEGYLLAITSDNAYGNIYTNAKTLTGEYEADNYCNIHDMLGNCFEWTTEYSSYNYNPCVTRGGHYFDSASWLTERNYYATNSNGVFISFRVQLYM